MDNRKSLFGDNEKLKIVRNILLFSALFFFTVGIIFWCILLVFLFKGCECDCACDISLFYYIGIIAVTVTFGLLTAVFSLNKMIDRNDDERVDEREDIFSIFESFNNATKTNEYVFVTHVIKELPENFKLSKIPELYVKNGFDFDKTMNSYYDLNTNKSFIEFEIIRCVKYSLRFLNRNESTKDNDHTNEHYLKSSLEYILNCFEGICFKIINQPKIDIDGFLPFEGIKDFYLKALYFMDLFSLYEKYIYIKLVVDKSLGATKAVVDFEKGEQK